jgi:hypothetical protein
VAFALTLSVLLHGVLVVGAWVYDLLGYGGFELPRREYAVEIVGVSAEEKAAPAPAPDPVKDEATKKEKAAEEKQASPPKKAATATKAAKPKAPAAPKVAEPPAPAKEADDAPVVAKDADEKAKAAAEAEAAKPEATEDEPAIPWPLDEPEAKAATSVDLPGAAPGDAALLIAFRLDRLRGGPWEAAVDRVLAPLPDYETIIAGSATPLAQLFDLLFIATPDVRDVTATFLAAHHHRDEAELEKTLAGAGATPRVTWSAAAGGTVGQRAKGHGVLREDPRVFLVPEPGWIVLARPEHLPGMLEPAPVVADATDAGAGANVAAVDGGAGAPTPTQTPTNSEARPRWMQRMIALVGDPADAPKSGPVVIFALASLGKRLVVPGVGVMPAPSATIVSVFAGKDGFRVVGALDFVDEHAATAFAAAAEKTRDAAMGSLISRHFIHKVNAGPAVAGLRFVARGKQVAVTTTVAAADAAVMLDAAAQWTAEWFNRHREADE